MSLIKINELYPAIEGEGIWQGLLCYFVRFSGCNLKCDFCDTEHKDCYKKNVESIRDEILKFYGNQEIKRVVITGGEPFLQMEEIEQLVNLLMVIPQCEMCIYTNGTIAIPDWIINSPKVHIIMDYKMKQQELMLHENMVSLSKKDVLKFVVDNVNQLQNIKRICEGYDCTFMITPSYDLINPMEIANKMIELKINNIKLGLQQHKYIYPSHMKGV